MRGAAELVQKVEILFAARIRRADTHLVAEDVSLPQRAFLMPAQPPSAC